ncbi:hypothetical protein FNF29_06821 [Cafeteria roenbergensis]|uniref:Cation/H+ exchanger domain-containing protein n=1 Tax=Cafeteria roenbergensis TaxID=33653 RepID=A0A5A8C527_CAFRO|nr:hypothetical protein FNF29_06821 [Cafeteria roenbergensis]|eukprot:KAA0148162.1 hypothetical protein FNF29_06821 [Cafeteria roenbergensis]
MRGAAAAVVALVAAAGAAHAAVTTVRVGLLLPNTSAPGECKLAHELFAGALNYTAHVNSLLGSDVRLQTVALGGESPAAAWAAAQAFLAHPAPCGNGTALADCNVVHAAVVGPRSSLGSEFVQLVAEQRRVPLLAYAASAPGLSVGIGGSEEDSAPDQFLRLCYSDEVTVRGLWAAVERFRWDIVVALHEQGSPEAQGQLEVLERQARAAAAAQERGEPTATLDGEPAQLVGSFPFDPLDPDSVTEALEAARDTGVRVLALLGTDHGAATLLRAAAEAGMVGKGWSWIGGGALRPAAWSADDDAAVAAAAGRGDGDPDPAALARIRQGLALRPRLSGVLAVLPLGASGVDEGSAPGAAAGAAASASGGGGGSGAEGSYGFGSEVLIPAAYTAHGSAPYPASAASLFPAPAPSACFPVVECALADGDAAHGACRLGRTDVHLPFTRQAIALLGRAAQALAAGGAAAAAARARAGVASGCPSDVAATAGRAAVCPALLVSAARVVAEEESGPLAAAAGAPDGVLPVPSFTAAGERAAVELELVQAQPGGADVALARWAGPAGWVSTGRPVVWPGGEAATPSDRVVIKEAVGAAVFVTFALGVTLSTFLAHALHRAGCSAIPESAITIALGAAVGAVIASTGDASAVRAARFDEELFALVLLPIIIAESGLVLDKHPFFSQLFSILTFALFGTIIATMVVGGAIFALGEAGLVLELTLEEALSYAALISAVDPVATLAVFSSQGVDPTLNALVYGEAVINDAVAIVLFTTASSFISSPVTHESVLAAVGSFFVVMIGSLALGGAFGLATTLMFRCVRPLSPPTPAPAAGGSELGDCGDEDGSSGAEPLDPAAPLHDDRAGEAALLPASGARVGGRPASGGGSSLSAASVPAAAATGASSGDIELAEVRRPAGASPRAPQPAAAAVALASPGTRVSDEYAGFGPDGPGGAAAAGQGQQQLHAGPDDDGSAAERHARKDDALASLVSGVAASAPGDTAPLPPPGSCRERFALTDRLGVVQAGTTLVMAYGSFAVAEALGLSGIVSSLFAGVAMNHWLTRALSPEGRRATQSTFRVLASLAETAVFFLIGANSALFSGVFDFGLVAASILLCLVARLLSVFPLAACLNLCRKDPIPLRSMTMMWIAGLRGAIAYATALRFPTQHQEEIVNATSWVVIFTIVVLGTASEPSLRCLGVPVGGAVSDPAARQARIRMTKDAQKESWLKRQIAKCDRQRLRPCLYAPEVLAPPGQGAGKPGGRQ